MVGRSGLDMLAIDLYISAENPVAAQQVLDYLISQAELLTRFPLTGRIPKPCAPRELVFTCYPYNLNLPSHQHQGSDRQSYPPVTPVSIAITTWLSIYPQFAAIETISFNLIKLPNRLAVSGTTRSLFCD